MPVLGREPASQQDHVKWLTQSECGNMRQGRYVRVVSVLDVLPFSDMMTAFSDVLPQGGRYVPPFNAVSLSGSNCIRLPVTNHRCRQRL